MDDPRLPYLRIAELLSAGFRDLWALRVFRLECRYQWISGLSPPQSKL
jgi:hypothetical protein